ncbi:HNH endonuclease signature motif containing protein [Nocardia tengchongensis]|uniref:HNH endonuclease signature motif containing protein n=1 Tax=Nocardia tengchongensis TaxID=2055889 RepID=UPI00361B2258
MAYVTKVCVLCGKPVRTKTGADRHGPCQVRETQRLARRAARRAAGEPSVCTECRGEINYDAGFSGRCQQCRERLRYIPEPLRRVICPPGSLCVYCGALATCIDHVRPIAAGGDSCAGNLEPSCAPCNLNKNGQTLAQWFCGVDSTEIGRRAARYSISCSEKVAAEWARLAGSEHPSAR